MFRKLNLEDIAFGTSNLLHLSKFLQKQLLEQQILEDKLSQQDKQ